MTQKVLCIGATLIDELYFCEGTIAPQSSNPAQRSTHIGGVMANIVQHLALLKVEVALLTGLGSDADAVRMKGELESIGVEVRASLTVNGPTGRYVSVLQPDGGLYVAVCHDPCTPAITPAVLAAQKEYLQGFEVLLADTNLPQPTLQWLIHFSRAEGKKLIIEPVSVPKAGKLATLDLQGVFMITPNEAELSAITGGNGCSEAEECDQLLNRGIQNLWLRKGNQGSVMHQSATHHAVGVPQLVLVDSTGAGDAALAGWLYAYLQGKSSLQCLQYGHALALNILLQKGAVDASITPERLNQLTHTYYHD